MRLTRHPKLLAFLIERCLAYQRGKRFANCSPPYNASTARMPERTLPSGPLLRTCDFTKSYGIW